MSSTEKRRKFYLELHIMVEDFSCLVQAVGKKIDELMAHLQSKEGHNQIDDLRCETHKLKKYQEDMKGQFMAIAMGLGGIESRQHKLMFKRKTKVVKEITSAQERIQELRKKEEGVIQKLNELSSIFQEKKEEDDQNKLLTSYGRHEIEVDLDSLGLDSFDGEWDLPEVIMKMYRLTPNRSKPEDKLLKELEAVFLRHSEDLKNLNKKFLMDKRQRGQIEKLNIFLQGFKEMISGKLEVLDYNERMFEAQKLMVNWLLEVEVKIFLLVNDLIFLIASNEEAVSNFRGFKQKFEKLKRSKRGRVPITVYCLLVLLGREVESVKDSETEFLFGESHGIVRKLMDRIYKMIASDIMFVLNVLGMPISDSNKKEAVLAAAEVLKHCDKELDSSQSAIKEAMEERHK